MEKEQIITLKIAFDDFKHIIKGVESLSLINELIHQVFGENCCLINSIDIDEGDRVICIDSKNDLFVLLRD